MKQVHPGSALMRCILLSLALGSPVHASFLDLSIDQSTFHFFGEGCTLKKSSNPKTEYAEIDLNSATRTSRFDLDFTRIPDPYLISDYDSDIKKRPGDSVSVKSCAIRFIIRNKSVTEEGKPRRFKLQFDSAQTLNYSWSVLEQNEVGFNVSLLYSIQAPGKHLSSAILSPKNTNKGTKIGYFNFPGDGFETECSNSITLVFRQTIVQEGPVIPVDSILSLTSFDLVTGLAVADCD